MTKKGDLSMGVVIGAAIALLILVLLSVMVFRAGGSLNRGTHCNAIENAFCEDEGTPCSDSNYDTVHYVIHPGGNCDGADMKCCIII